MKHPELDHARARETARRQLHLDDGLGNMARCFLALIAMNESLSKDLHRIQKKVDNALVGIEES